jgi:hypothetical protein
MSEEKKVRTLDEVSKEYGQLCAKAGNIQYQIYVFTKDLALLNEELQTLNFEAAKLQAAEKKES